MKGIVAALMESEDPFKLQKLCKICLLSDSEFHLFKIKCEGKILVNIFESCLNLDVERNVDHAPYSICSACLPELIKFYKFKKQCLQSDAIIKDVLFQINKNTIAVEENEELTLMESDLINEVIEDSLCIKEEVPITEDEEFVNNKIEFIKSEDEIDVNTFNLESSLKIHMKLSHKNDLAHSNENSLANKQHTCRYCKQGYKPFECDQCDKGFFLKGRLDKHYLEHTGGVLKCDICGGESINQKCRQLAEYNM
ncbi:unnamed protein product [Brassicogethes aeneus]|uniref:Uncharacterized protein n=1 Tax=Brassicogethes aeneus TaxID=1431903 RepID=A0A9P0B5X0_BRAAE|nr:unnamed protein product [Brassicogethes aeneus]